MITFCIVLIILAIAGIVLGVGGLGLMVVFGDAIIGLVLLVFVFKKLFFRKKNKNKDKNKDE